VPLGERQSLLFISESSRLRWGIAPHQQTGVISGPAGAGRGSSRGLSPPSPRAAGARGSAVGQAQGDADAGVDGVGDLFLHKVRVVRGHGTSFARTIVSYHTS